MIRIFGFLMIALVLFLFSVSDIIAQQGELFVSDFGSGTITRMNLDGSGATIIVSGLTLPEDGTCRADGMIFFAESSPGRIRMFDRNGGGLTTIYFI
jgi:hypothetical protein